MEAKHGQPKAAAPPTALRHPITRSVKHTEHLVSAHRNPATVARERFGQKCPMDNRPCLSKPPSPNPLREPSRSFDVRKEKRQRPSPKHSMAP